MARASRPIGFWIFCVANVAVGALNLAWHAFDPAHQPIQAFGDRIPGQEALAYAAGIVLVAGGTLALTRGRFARVGALLLLGVSAAIATFWLPRLYTAPLILGFTFPVMAGVLAGLCMHLVIVAGALLAYADVPGDASLRPDVVSSVARWTFGLSAIVFGANHLASISANLMYVPTWMPFGQPFWVVCTGVAFILAGIAFLTRRADVAAAWLLGLMWLTFSAVTLLPSLVAGPRPLASWGGNAYEFVLVGAAWMLAHWLATHRGKPAGARAT